MHRVNVMLKDETWTALQALPKGERSQFVNEAILLSFTLRRRQQAAARLAQLRSTMTPLPVDLTQMIRDLRDAH